MADIVTTTCSACSVATVINVDTGEGFARVPSNGKRGDGHVPAHEVTFEVLIDAEGDLAMWDCPVCDNAESVYADPQVRRDLGS